MLSILVILVLVVLTIIIGMLIGLCRKAHYKVFRIFNLIKQKIFWNTILRSYLLSYLIMIISSTG